LHDAVLRLLPIGQGTFAPQRSPFHRDRRNRKPRGAQPDGRAIERTLHGAADLHRRDACRRLRRIACAQPRRRARRPARRRRHCAVASPSRTLGMNTPQPATFTVALVQMCSGLAPAANLDAAIALIRQAQAGGASYVQTPEMTNIMDIRRERLFGAMVAEEADASLARLRDLARELGIYLHIGSLAVK